MPDNNNKKKLYDVVVEKGFYTKSFEKFNEKYSSTENSKRLYDVLYEKGLYTNTEQDFNEKYFSEVKKKEPLEPGLVVSPEDSEPPTEPIRKPIEYREGELIDERLLGEVLSPEERRIKVILDQEMRFTTDPIEQERERFQAGIQRQIKREVKEEKLKTDPKFYSEHYNKEIDKEIDVLNQQRAIDNVASITKEGFVKYREDSYSNFLTDEVDQQSWDIKNQLESVDKEISGIDETLRSNPALMELSEKDRNTVKQHQLDLLQSERDELAVKSKEFEENRISDIDSKIGEMSKSLMTETDPEQQTVLTKRIKLLSSQKENFFKDINENTENLISKGGIAVTGKKTNSKEDFDKYYDALYQEFKELSDTDLIQSMIGQRGALNQIGTNIYAATIGGGDEELNRFGELTQLLEEYAPIRLLNRYSTGETVSTGFILSEDRLLEGVKRFGETFVEGLTTSMTPFTVKSQREESQKLAVDLIGLGIPLNENIKVSSDIDEKGNFGEYGLTDPEYWGNMTGVSAGIMIQMAATPGTSGLGLVKGVKTTGNMLKVMNRARAITNLSKGKILGSLLQKNAVNFSKKALTTGIDYQKAGFVFRSNEEELNFVSGLYGSVGEQTVMAMIPKSKVFAPILKKFFSTEGSKKVIDVVSKFGKSVGAKTGRGFGETAEEFAQEIASIHMDDNVDFYEELEKRFGTLDKSSKFVISSFVMGFAMGGGTSISNASQQSFKAQLSELKESNPDQAKKVESVIEAINSEVGEALEASIDENKKSKLDSGEEGYFINDEETNKEEVIDKIEKAETQEELAGIDILNSKEVEESLGDKIKDLAPLEEEQKIEEDAERIRKEAKEPSIEEELEPGEERRLRVRDIEKVGVESREREEQIQVVEGKEEVIPEGDKYEIVKHEPVKGEGEVDFVNVGNIHIDAEVLESGEIKGGLPESELLNEESIKSRIEVLKDEKNLMKDDSDIKEVDEAISFLESFVKLEPPVEIKEAEKIEEKPEKVPTVEQSQQSEVVDLVSRFNEMSISDRKSDEGVSLLIDINERVKEYGFEVTQADVDQDVSVITSEGVPIKEFKPEIEIEAEIKPKKVDVKEKVRGFAKQVLADERVSGIVKKGVEPRSKYTPKKMTTTEAEAQAVLDDLGVEDSNTLFLDPKGSLAPDVKVGLGQKLILKYNSLALEETDVKLKKEKYNKAITVANTLAEFHTKMGQANNAARIYFALSPEGQLLAFQKNIAKARKSRLDDDKEYLVDIEEIISKANVDTVNEILNNPKIQAAINEIYGKASTRKGKNKPKSSKRKKRIVSQAVDFLESIKIDTTGKAFDVTYALVAHTFNSAITTIQVALKAGQSISDAISKAADYINDTHKGVWDEKGFKRDMDIKLNKFTALENINDEDYERGIEKGLKELGTDINELIRKHYTEQNKTKKALVDKFIDELGFNESESTRLSNEIDKAFKSLATKKKQKALNNLVAPKTPLTAKTNNKKKKLHDKIIELSNLGALSTAEYHEAYADKMELPTLNDEQAKRIMELAEISQTVKGQIQINKAQKDLLSYQRTVQEINWKDITLSLWYAHMLSGPKTQTINIWANAVETVGEGYISVIQDPRNAYILFRGLLKGYKRGFKESRAVLTTKYGSVKGVKVEVASVLEDVRFKGGPFNPLNYSKFVTRVMDAADTFFYQGLREMRFHELAARQAREEGVLEPGKSTYAKVSELLYNDKESLQLAEDQALNEGYKPKSLGYDRRVSEIIEEKRNIDWAEDTDDFASRGTFNYDPEGTMGVISNNINSFIQKVPALRFIVPFTRILANVSNKYMDWSPIGAIRLIKGGIGWGEYKNKYSKEDKRRVAAKFTTGTMAMVALALLDDGEDDDGFFQITANGYGDRGKNYELKETGWREFSIRIGDVWYSYKNTPLGVALAIIGYQRDNQRYHGDREGGVKADILVMGMTKYMMSFSFMQSVSDFFGIFSEGPSYKSSASANKLGKFFTRTAKGLLVPNIINQSNKLYQEIIDSPMKRSEVWYQDFYKDIPYFNDNMMNIYNTLGDEVVPNLSNDLLPFGMKEVEVDEIYDLLQKNRVFIGSPPKTITIRNTRRKLEPREYNDYGRISGQMIKRDIIKNFSRLSKLDKEKFKKEIDKIKRNARKKTRNKLFKK